MRPRCPACGTPCEDDGDRYYDDRCFECGWRSAYRLERDRINASVQAQAQRERAKADRP